MTASFPPPGTVRLTGGSFRTAQLRDQEYLLRLDPQRLLAPYFREAGVEAPADPYGNWESQGLDGHTAGHYLSATSLMFAHTGDARFRDRAREVVDGLARAQNALGTGYVGGVPLSAELWAEVATGRIAATTFTQSGRWVPWYNLHKMFAGLIEAHRSAHIDSALDIALRLADWWLELAGAIGDRDFELMLETEFGGMNESFADLASLTGRPEYLAMARRFSHRAVLDPLVEGRDRLTGLHANTQLPKILGYQRFAELTGDPRYANAASFFFRTVTQNRSVAIGGHGVREHFHAPDDFHTMFEDREGPESCNSYNMMRLAAELYRADGDAAYLEYIERTLHNHVLSAQHPVHGGFVYFTPLRPNHYRVYSQPETSFWCCVGTGMEAHARHAAYIFAERGERLAVNLFIDSAIDWRGISLTQEAGAAPDFGTVLSVTAEGRHRRTIDVRIPGWTEGSPTVVINGEPRAVPTEHGYLRLDREWADGDTVAISFPAAPRLEWPPDGSGWVSVAWGPLVYGAPGDADDLPGLRADSGRMSHIAGGALRPLAQAPIVTESRSARALAGTAEGNVVLTTAEGPVTLIPFSRIHDARCTVYFPWGADAAARRRELELRDEWQLGVDARTQDVLTLGEQQPESDHGFRSDSSELGREGDTAWRRTASALSATLSDWRRTAEVIRLSWLDGDGNVDYELLANGIVVTRIVRTGGDISPVVCTEEFELPPGLRHQDADSIEIGVRAAAGSRTDRITELRLLSRGVGV